MANQKLIQSLVGGGLVLMASQAAMAGVVQYGPQVEIKGLYRVNQDQLSTVVSKSLSANISLKDSDQLINQLFGMGFFNNIALYKQGDQLIIDVVERPTIGAIKITGNNQIKTADIEKVLNQVGIEKGNTFNPTILNQVKQSLDQEYYAQGKYAVKVKTKVVSQARNQVSVNIHISEGIAAKIEQINIVGNHHFTSHELIKAMKISTPGIMAFFTDSDKYTPQKMDASLRQLYSYYNDRGYINFKVLSSKVSIDPTRRYFVINVAVKEGARYTFSGYHLSGDLRGAKAHLDDLVKIKANAVYSRAQVIDAIQAMTHYYGNLGYAFVNVRPAVVKDDKTHQVAIHFYISTGQKAYIHHINFYGNTVTKDKTLRQMMLYQEGSVYNADNLAQSKLRLDRLKYFANVGQSTQTVPGQSDSIDVNYRLKERSMNQLRFSLGYSQLDKVIFGLGLSLPNVLGSGNSFSTDLSLSKPVKTLSFSYTDPYFTLGGISQTISMYGQSIDNNYRQSANYSTDSYGGSLTYGLPISADNKFNVGVGVDHTELEQPYNATSMVVKDFVKKYHNSFYTYSASFGVSRDTTNAPYFPSDGMKGDVSATVGLPGSTMTYYTTNLDSTWYFPVGFKRYSWSLGGGIDYGKGYGKTSELPLFKNFNGGGWGSVRGFYDNSLGPKDTIETTNDDGSVSDTRGNSIGGNLSLHANLNFFMPIPDTDTDTARFVAYADAGNVYSTYQVPGAYNAASLPRHPQLNDLRYSVGVGFVWISPVGPLGISFSKPFKVRPGDNTSVFQFNLGMANF